MSVPSSGSLQLPQVLIPLTASTVNSDLDRTKLLGESGSEERRGTITPCKSQESLGRVRRLLHVIVMLTGGLLRPQFPRLGGRHVSVFRRILKNEGFRIVGSRISTGLGNDSRI